MNILFFGGHYWDRGAWFRKQQFAQRLVNRGHRVFYIEDSVSMIRRNSSDKNEYFKTKVTKVNDNLYIITPSAIFPYPQNYYSRSLYNLKLFYDIKSILKKYKVSNFIVWSSRIEFSSNIQQIKSTKILDLCDDLPFYAKLAGNEKNYNILMQYLTKALSNSDILIVSAQKIKEKYGNLSDKEIIVVPNGHNIKLNNSTYILPEDMKKIKKPIIGFIGTLFRFIDDSLLEYIISENPDYSFVFIGSVENNFPLNKISRYENVHLPGKKPKDEIPSYIQSFDVCLNPFKVHEVNDSVNPVKVFEYLVMKKPVVSTLMYSLKKENIADYITFAESYETFSKKLRCIVDEKRYINDIPDKAIENYHWDSLFLSMIKEIKSKHGLEL